MSVDVRDVGQFWTTSTHSGELFESWRDRLRPGEFGQFCAHFDRHSGAVDQFRTNAGQFRAWCMNSGGNLGRFWTNELSSALATTRLSHWVTKALRPKSCRDTWHIAQFDHKAPHTGPIRSGNRFIVSKISSIGPGTDIFAPRTVPVVSRTAILPPERLEYASRACLLDSGTDCLVLRTDVFGLDRRGTAARDQAARLSVLRAAILLDAFWSALDAGAASRASVARVFRARVLAMCLTSAALARVYDNWR